MTLIQIDEPIFSTCVADLTVGKQAVELIAGAIKIPTCMHVCGNLANVIDDILKIERERAGLSSRRTPRTSNSSDHGIFPGG